MAAESEDLVPVLGAAYPLRASFVLDEVAVTSPLESC